MRGLLAIAALFALSSGALAEDAGQAPPPASGQADKTAAAAAAKPKKPAEIRAEQLDILFAHLHRKGVSAGPVEEKIWALWSASDSPTAEILLAEAQNATDDGAPAQALSILNRLIGANPDFAEAWNKRATLYFLMKRYDDALKDIAKVLDLEPRHFGALAGKGMILERQKKYAEARAAYEEALAVNPALEEVQQKLKDLDKVEQGI